jgi:hypothetical protein
MRYNIPKWAFIASGANLTIGYGFNNGTSDEGAQFVQGSPQDHGGLLISTNHAKQLDLQGNVWYSFNVSNVGSETWMKLEGGGLI